MSTENVPVAINASPTRIVHRRKIFLRSVVLVVFFCIYETHTPSPRIAFSYEIIVFIVHVNMYIHLSSWQEKAKKAMTQFSWVNWSEVARQGIIEKEKLQELLVKLETKKERELTKWAVALGRKAKKGRWQRILKELSEKERKELLGE